MTLAGGLMAFGCTSAPVTPQPQRLAILRFENLGPEAATDWMGRALPEVITGELAGVPGLYCLPASRIRGSGRTLGVRPAAAPGISTEEDAALASGANR